MVRESTRTPMGHNTREIGKTTNRMAKALKPGQTVRSTSASMSRARSMERANSRGATAPVTKGSSKTTTSMVEASTSGPMVVDMRETGETTKWTVEECSHGKTAAAMMESMWKIRRKGMGRSLGLMEGCTKASGRKGSSMAEGCTQLIRESRRKGRGKRERG